MLEHGCVMSSSLGPHLLPGGGLALPLYAGGALLLVLCHTLLALRLPVLRVPGRGVLHPAGHPAPGHLSRGGGGGGGGLDSPVALGLGRGGDEAGQTQHGGVEEEHGGGGGGGVGGGGVEVSLTLWSQELVPGYMSDNTRTRARDYRAAQSYTGPLDLDHAWTRPTLAQESLDTVNTGPDTAAHHLGWAGWVIRFLMHPLSVHMI